MRKLSVISRAFVFARSLVLFFTPRNSHEKTGLSVDIRIATSIKIYSHMWDGVMIERRFEVVNDSNLNSNVVLHASPASVVGLNGFKHRAWIS
jgi:hypothetical protein